jgi:hypothetical protein
VWFRALLVWMIGEIEWIILHPMLAGSMVGAGVALSGGFGPRVSGQRHYPRRGKAADVGTAMSPQPVEESNSEEQGPMQQMNGTRGSPLDPRRFLRANVRDMSPSGMRWYVAASAAVGILAYLVRLPLRRRPISWPRLVIDVAVNAALPAIVVWSFRFVEKIQRAQANDATRAAHDFEQLIRQRADARGDDLVQETGGPSGGSTLSGS